MHFERTRDTYVVSTAPELLDIDAVHAYLVRSYWAEGIPKSVVERSIQGSLCFGLHKRLAPSGSAQVGFARVVSDRATFAYLCDVYVLEAERGRGLGKWLIETLLAHPELQNLRRFMLGTRDAHGLYAPRGFTPLARPHTFMEIARPGLYTQPAVG
ncbi:MAG TPA: GNAT family N-acetyltransferase [Polyangiaceae bacterium]|nr:GNAT family N-acetyltransferase [Polyangiaceae bacterium]